MLRGSFVSSDPTSQVDQDVNFAILVQGLLHDFINFVLFGQIRWDGSNFSAQLFDLLHPRFQPVLASGHQHQLCPFSGKGLGYSLSDLTVSAHLRHNRDLVLQPQGITSCLGK